MNYIIDIHSTVDRAVGATGTGTARRASLPFLDTGPPQIVQR
jgi:hypothetical protein